MMFDNKKRYVLRKDKRLCKILAGHFTLIAVNINKACRSPRCPYCTVQERNAVRRMPPEWVQCLIIEKIAVST